MYLGFLCCIVIFLLLTLFSQKICVIVLLIHHLKSAHGCGNQIPKAIARLTSFLVQMYNEQKRDKRGNNSISSIFQIDLMRFDNRFNFWGLRLSESWAVHVSYETEQFLLLVDSKNRRTAHRPTDRPQYTPFAESIWSKLAEHLQLDWLVAFAHKGLWFAPFCNWRLLSQIYGERHNNNSNNNNSNNSRPNESHYPAKFCRPFFHSTFTVRSKSTIYLVLLQLAAWPRTKRRNSAMKRHSF